MTPRSEREARIHPEKGCAEVLLDTLRTRRGVKAVTVEPKSGELALRYDPQEISLKRIEALAAEVAARLAATKEGCAPHREGTPCSECPEFVEASREELPGVRWIAPGGGEKRLGVEIRHPPGDLREFRLTTRRLKAARFTWLSRQTVLEGLPVLLCGGLLASGWVVELSGLPGAALWLFIAAAVAGGVPTVWSTVGSLLERRLDVDLLMLTGAAGAAVLGYWDESAVLLFLFTLSSALESFAMGRTRAAVEKLIALRPDEATILREGSAVRVPVEEVRSGDLLNVKPGERIPLDGIVREGEADVDESALTGESMPRSKASGSTLLAGSINLNGSLVAEVTREARESTLSRIVELVEEARETRAPTQRIFERFARYYIVAIVLGAAATAIVPPLLGSASWSEMFYRSMILLVVASPCALVISTPATILSAIATAARRGILFKGGASVEALGQASAVAFDKTGTLTDGVLSVTAISPSPGRSAEEVLRLAAAAEAASEHVLAHAVVEEADRRGLDLPPVTGFKAHPGLGIEAEIEGERVLVGNRRFLELQSVRGELALPSFEGGAIGKSVLVARGEEVIGHLHFGDHVRPGAAAAVRRLRELGIRQVVMLTGDGGEIARQVGRAVGIDDLRADLLPAEKVRELEALADAGERTIMVGDGVNDAPAMAASSTGVAMGAAGTDVALEAADVVLMASDLEKLVEAVEIGRRARRVLYQNLIFATAVIVVLVTLGLAGTLALPLGVSAHEGSTLIVVLNGLRLLVWRGEVPRGTPGRGAAKAERAEPAEVGQGT